VNKLNQAINEEIARAFHGLGAPAEAVRAIPQGGSADEVVMALAAHGAPPELLGIVNSYGDTMDDQEVLEMLRTFNDQGYAIEPDPTLTSAVTPFRRPRKK
jgi:hypothetical protein